MLADWYVAENAYLALSKIYGGLSRASVTGKTYWVDSTDTNAADVSGRGTVTAPFATVDYAVGQCTASRGDVILVKPNHVETFSTSVAVDIDVAGVAVIGLSHGNVQPTLTFTHASAKVELAAAGCRFEGFSLVCDVNSQAVMVSISADGCVLANCRLYSSAPASKQPVDVIQVQSGPDDITIVGNHLFFRDDTATLTKGIEVSAGVTRLHIIGNTIDVKTAGAESGCLYLDAAGTCAFVTIRGNHFVNTGAISGGIINIETSTTHTGIVCYNVGHCGHATANETAAKLAYCENYFGSDLTLSGTIDPAIS